MTNLEDITKEELMQQNERLKLEIEALQEKEDIYINLVDNMGEGLGITDINENFIFANSSAEKIFGVNTGCLVGKNLNEFLYEEDKIFIKEQTKKRITNESSLYGIRIMRPDGLIKYLDVNATPKFDRNGYAGSIGVFEDITEHKEAEEELIKQKNIMSAVLNSMSNLVFVLDSEGIYLNYLSSINQELIQSPKEFIGKKIEYALPLDVANKVYEAIKKTLSTNSISSFGYDLDFGDTKKHYHAEISPLEENKVVANILDDTKIHTLIDKLKESNDTKNKFFSIIAHDLRGPFGAVMGLTNIIDSHFNSDNREELLSAEELKSYTKEIKTSVESTFNLIENLMEWGRIQMKDIKYNPKFISVYDLVELSYNPLLSSAKLKSINITYKKEMETSLYVDLSSASTVLRNLINNSIKFTNEGGKINIEGHILKEENNHSFYEIVISDTGIGMDSDLIAKLFNKNNITEESRQGTSGEKGTNLGLYLSKEYVKMNGGNIYAESLGKDKGSTFKVQFPLYPRL